ncbi:MAG: hypothetical protein R3F60_08415 [bacterium]
MHPGSITALRSDAAGFYFAVARVGLFGQIPPTSANITAVHRPGSLNAGVPSGNIAFDRTTNAGAETWLASVARHDAAAGQYHPCRPVSPGPGRR